MTKLIKEKQLKTFIKKEGFRAGKKAILKLSAKLEENLKLLTEKAERNARISGRKTLKPEDVS